MNEVFINYRTGDGDEAAVLLEHTLSERFGKDAIFRAAKSIAPGQTYPAELISAVRRCSVLLAVVGPDWIHHPGLHDADDWVRREILEAFGSANWVIPVLKGRQTERLTAAALPLELAWLADVQSLRLDVRDNGADLKRIGDELAVLVPSLKNAEPPLPARPGPGSITNSAADVQGTVVQGQDITGDIGTVIKGNHGPVHAGKGDVYQDSQHFTGEGAAYVQGDNQGGISHHFGRSPSQDEGDR